MSILRVNILSSKKRDVHFEDSNDFTVLIYRDKDMEKMRAFANDNLEKYVFLPVSIEPIQEELRSQIGGKDERRCLL